MAIAGVPETKAAEDTVSDKIAKAAAGAAEAARVMLADSDDVQGHEEL